MVCYNLESEELFKVLIVITAYNLIVHCKDWIERVHFMISEKHGEIASKEVIKNSSWLF